MGTMTTFKMVIVAQAFYAFAITLLLSVSPGLSDNFVTSYGGVAEAMDFSDLATQTQGSVSSEINIPNNDLGALVFFSGNIIIDLLLNFFTAIPQIIGLLLMALTTLFNLPSDFILPIQTFLIVVVVAIYFITLLAFLSGLRSGRQVT